MDGVAAAEGARDAHIRLVRALEAVNFDDAVARGASGLPGWSVGHVLTHIARSADSHTRMIEAAKAGAPVAQYAEGPDQRVSEIEVGAGRSAAELLDDLRHSDDALAVAYNRVDDATWGRDALRWNDHAWPVLDLPFLRWREVALHTTDLLVPGIGSDIWSPQYVDHELRRQVGSLAARLNAPIAVRLAPSDAEWSTVVMTPGELPHGVETVEGSVAEILAWTVGRGHGNHAWPALTPWVGAP